LIVALVVTLIGLAWGSFLMLSWAAAVGLLAFAGQWWSRTAWSHVEVEVTLEPARAFVGEDVLLRVTIRNGKSVPIPIVRLALTLPEDLAAAVDDTTMLAISRRRLSLGGRTEASAVFPLIASRRGEHWFEALEVSLADPLDLVPVRRTVAIQRSLIVMPEPVGGVPMHVRRRLAFGAPAPSARLFEDREHFAGVRDYEPGDPMHHVHWRLSGHAGSLQTMRFDPTRSAEVLFALDVAHGEPFWLSADPASAEQMIGWASFAARQALAAGWRVGLVANTHLRKGAGPLRISSAVSAGREAVLFTALARMPNQPTSDLASVLREVGRRMVRRTTVLVFSPEAGPALHYEMEVLRRRGADVVHVTPGGPT
jgi:uncharacterized protein (DUF58 family)